MRLNLAIFIIFISGCVSNSNISDVQPRNGIGLSKETAITLECVSSGFDGVMKEAKWISEFYPGYQKIAQAVGDYDDRIFDRIIIKQGSHKLELFFDITNWYGKLEKIELPEYCDQKLRVN